MTSVNKYNLNLILGARRRCLSVATAFRGTSSEGAKRTSPKGWTGSPSRSHRHRARYEVVTCPLWVGPFVTVYAYYRLYGLVKINSTLTLFLNSLPYNMYYNCLKGPRAPVGASKGVPSGGRHRREMHLRGGRFKRGVDEAPSAARLDPVALQERPEAAVGRQPCQSAHLQVSRVL